MVKQQQMMLAGSLMGALVVVVVAMWFVLGSDAEGRATPSIALLGALLVAGVGTHLFNEALGYRTVALDPGTGAGEARRAAVQAYSAAMIRRFAASEAIGLASLALAFVVGTGGFVVVAVGCAVSLVLMVVHVWPSRRSVDKVAASLERDGADSHLREAFGMRSGQGGAIREL